MTEMFEQTRRFVAASTLAIFSVAALPVLADGPVLLTVTGAVENTNRGAVDPEYDKLFAFNDVSFDNAMEFDLDALQALPQAVARADFPKGGGEVEFTGPLVADLLDAAGATGKTVTISAMDGYSVEIPLDEMVEKGAVLALSRDGRPFGIGNFGPAQVVFPRAERADLAEMPDDWWVWQIYLINVE